MQYLGDEVEFLVQFCKTHQQEHRIDYYVFGHRHLPIEKKIENSIYFNLGDWISYNTYLQFNCENQTIGLKSWV